MRSSRARAAVAEAENTSAWSLAGTHEHAHAQVVLHDARFPSHPVENTFVICNEISGCVALFDLSVCKH